MDQDQDLSLTIFSFMLVYVYCGTAERRLLQDLLEYYQKFERPVANEADAVQLKFGLTLQQIMDVVSFILGFGFFHNKYFDIWPP